jgi:hypothetical protein
MRSGSSLPAKLAALMVSLGPLALGAKPTGDHDTSSAVATDYQAQSL